MFQKGGPLFLFFEIFTAEFSQFLVTKKTLVFVCRQKVTKFCRKNFKNCKKCSTFLEHFFGLVEWG
jgi:hypothetical protein